MAAPQGVRSAGYRPQNTGGGGGNEIERILAQMSGKPQKGLDYGETFRDRMERRRSEFGRGAQENGQYGSKPGEGSRSSQGAANPFSAPAGRAQAAVPAVGAAFGGTPGFGSSAPAGGASMAAPGGGQQQGYSFGGGPSVASGQPYGFGPQMGQSVASQGPTVQAPASQMTQPFQYGAQPHQTQGGMQPALTLGGGGGRMGGGMGGAQPINWRGGTMMGMPTGLAGLGFGMNRGEPPLPGGAGYV